MLLSSEPPPRPTAALLGGCASLAAAARLHAHLLKSSRLSLSPFLANRLAAAYSRLGAAESTVALFHDAPAKNLFSYNILLAALLRCRGLGTARRVFDQMPQKDTVSYNSMISGYITNGRAGEAFELVYTMRELGVRPTGFTLSIVSLGVCSARHGMQIHATAVRHGLGISNTVVGNSLIDMYRHVGLMENALRVFEGMEEPDVVSWNSLMSVYKNAGWSGRVFECFRLMRSLGFRIDEFSVSMVLSVCTDVEELGKGEQLLALCFKMGFLWNSIVSSAVIDMLCVSDRLGDAVWLFKGMARWNSELCNAMISGYSRSGLMEEALDLFAMALRNGVLPTEFTFASILRSSSCFGLTEHGTQIHGLVCKLGFEDDVIVANALIDMYSKLGSMKHATKIFDRIDVKDLVLWNTMTLGLSFNGRGKEALRIFWWMLKSGMKPDRITLLGVLSACSLEGMVHDGMKVISLVKNDYHFVLGPEHYACVVDMLSRAGMIKQAVDFVENKLQKRNSAIFLTLLEASMIHGDFGVAELIADKMIKLEPRSSLPYTVLARIYGARGKWESMARIWRSMEEHRARKVQGCSWLCIKNHIHVFSSKQILHHGGEATYAALDLLAWDMIERGYASRYVLSQFMGRKSHISEG